MTIDGLDDMAIRRILTSTKRVALVGISDRPSRPSYGVMAWLMRRGYDVTPVNPKLAGAVVHGKMVLASLDEAAAQAPLEMVDIFRASPHVPPVVDDAIRLGAQTVWMQLGVINADAARRAREAGLDVVMDRCPAIEVPRLGL